MRIMLFANLTGGAVTLVSMFLPWVTLSFPGSSFTRSFSLIEVNSVGVPFLIATGAILSLVSRFGALSSLAGIGLASQSSLVHFLSTGPFSYVHASGFWIGLTGVLISMMGQSWTPTVGFPKVDENKKKLALILLPLGMNSMMVGISILHSGAGEPYDAILVELITILGGLTALGIGIATLYPHPTQPLVAFLKRLVWA